MIVYNRTVCVHAKEMVEKDESERSMKKEGIKNIEENQENYNI